MPMRLGFGIGAAGAAGYSHKASFNFASGSYRVGGTTSATLGDVATLTITQAATTWAENTDGSLTKFAANTPRITNRGLLLESAATEMLGASTDLSGWTIASATRAGSQTAPDGTTTATRITDSGGSYGQAYVGVTTTVSAGSYIMVRRVKKESAGAAICALRVQLSGTTTTQDYWIYLAPDTGAYSTSGAWGAVSVTDKGNWWLVTGTLTSTAHTTAMPFLGPAYRVNGGAVDSAAATGAATEFLPNLFAGSTAFLPCVGNRSACAGSITIPSGSSDDVIVVTYGSGTRKTMLRSALASPTAINLASDGGAPWLNSYITKIDIYGASRAIDETIYALRTAAASGGLAQTQGAPTITYGSYGGASTLTGTLVAWNTSGSFNLLGGQWAVAGVSYPDTILGRARSVTYSADGTNYYAINPCVEFNHTGDALEFYLKGNTGPSSYRLWIDDKLSETAFPTVPTSPDSVGGLHYILVDFGSSAMRKVRLEGLNGRMSFGGVKVKTGQAVTATSAYPLRLVAVGDSFTEGSGATQGYGFAPLLAQELGLKDFVNSGSGGTGWLQDAASPARVKLTDRWSNDVTNNAPSVLLLAMGYNDIGDGNDAAIQTQAASLLASYLAAFPSSLIVVLGPWDSRAYTSQAPSAACTSLTNALRNACTGIAGCYFKSMEGVAFEPVGGGNIHPVTAGHASLKNDIYDWMASTFSLRARS